MNAASAHDVNGRMQEFADLSAKSDEFHKAEATVLKVEEQVNVACRPSFAARDGAEQKQLRSAQPPQVNSMAAQGGYDTFTIHLLTILLTET